MSECHTICSFTLLLIRASERVSFLDDGNEEEEEEEEEEEALNQIVISFRESHNSAPHLSLPSRELD